MELPSLADLLSRDVALETVSDTARLDLELLLADAIGKNRTYLYTWPEKVPTPEQLIQFEQSMQRRINGEPVAYILGYQDFWSLRLKVSAATLIPRPETELLVETALELLPGTHSRVADLGTGTGAIVLALASERPSWELIGVDFSEEAVSLAEQNRVMLAFDNVEMIQGSWCQPLQGRSFDMIVSNPPYIDADDVHLSQGDVRFEPSSALVADEHGLADIRTISEQALTCLNPQGWLLFEHGYQQAEAVQQILRSLGYIAVRTIEDLAGHPRVTLGQRP